MKFKSKKSFLVGVIVWSVSLFVPTITIVDILQKHNLWIGLIIILPALIPIWIWFDTYYIIENGLLKYKSAFIKGAIDILSIKEVIVGKTQFVGNKPALGTKGLIVKYNRWDDVYISPKNETVFLEELLKVNSEITIVQKIN